MLGLSPADSDSWLNVDPAQLEAMLGQQYGPKGATQPASLREKVQVFLNQKSDIDGVQLFGYKSLCFKNLLHGKNETVLVTVYRSAEHCIDEIH